ncbi:Uncharacterized protein OBRU01_01481 [Operophtera brumata]|uniref:Uncharacterized protein n=1 Tax=Operophtera brumata TaxID=104452 RepID=A0A0L7LJM5_OPEBR|nr:Uncharacterized protein OBRU01_01481 [Operophtera brumata]
MEVTDLNRTVARLEGELTALAQNNKRNEIEIEGFPENQIEVAAINVGVEQTDGDVDWIMHIGPLRPRVLASSPDESGRQSRRVVVRLLRRAKRDGHSEAYEPMTHDASALAHTWGRHQVPQGK